jgi:hypothetical protein
MKPHTRRYREILTGNTFSVAATSGTYRIHDCLKGWGTVDRDGKSVLWDHWRPATKKQREKLERHWAKNPPFSKMIFPVIKSMQGLDTRSLLDDLVSVQPMSGP